MPRNGKISDKVEVLDDTDLELMRRMKIGGGVGDPGLGLGVGLYPERPGEPDCLFYLRYGNCGFGNNCRYNHPSKSNVNVGGQVNGGKNRAELPERPGQPDCEFFLKTGMCKFGASCKYHHPKDRQPEQPVLLNAVGLPLRQDAQSCQYYMQTGVCKFGCACKFNHPPLFPPPLPPHVLSVSYGSGGSAVVPSSVGELSTAALSNATYFPSPVVQFPQTFMPLMLSQPQGWNTYMGNMSPLSVPSVYTPPASSVQLSAESYLPERPDQPECRNFMRYGSCKYGSDCKYHHPRERISEVTATSLGPLMLPLRPGHPVCSDYSVYGICKYGPSCTYDHPTPPINPYAYSFGVPPAVATSYLPSTTPYYIAPSLPVTSPSKLSSDKNQRSNTLHPRAPKSVSEVAHDESD